MKRYTYDEIKDIEKALADLPYGLSVIRVKVNEYLVLDEDGNELKLSSYNQIATLLNFIKKNLERRYEYEYKA